MRSRSKASVLAADRGRRQTKGRGSGKPARLAPGSASRRLAIEAIVRINRDGAYANLVLPEMLERSTLGAADRRFVTELVYGSTRMRRACRYLADRFLVGPVDDEVAAALQIGAYQLAFLGTPAHAAVAATVGAVRGRGRSVVNAVLRKVADAPVSYPDRATELSYPDWLVDRMTDFLGPDVTDAALRAMNRPAVTNVRDDGYVQDIASQRVVELVGAGPGQIVVDVCAAPGGKATGLAASGAFVVAADRRLSRTRLVAANAGRLGSAVGIVVADGRMPAVRPGSADKVLVDAPCSGFGSLRRRADARWRIEPEAPERLADLQVELVLAALDLVRPGGEVVYSVCTLDQVEGPGVIDQVLRTRPDVSLGDRPGAPWIGKGSVAVLLPDEHDGMMFARLIRSAGRDA